MTTKRGATSDLNHDNWDQEDTPEEAGVFAKASSDQLKTRVIKKAKRRGIAPKDSAPNAFSGFGGFKGFDPPAAPSGEMFSFLSKPDAKSKEEEEEAIGAQDPKPANGNPNPDTPVPTATGSFNFSGLKQNSAAASASAKWTCSSCLVPNDADKDACVCCQAAKPGAPAKPAASPVSAFKFGAGTSSSDTTGGSSGFKFGVASSTPPKSSLSESSGFKFGETSENSTKTNEGFKFGSSDTEKPKASVAGFKFGSSDTEKPKTSQPDTTFKFGSSSDSGEKPKTSTSFEVVPPPNSSSDKEEINKAPATITTKEDEKPEENSEFFEYPNEFFAKLKALNTQVSDWIQKNIEKNSFVLLTPIFEDYEKHWKELKEEFKDAKKSSASVISSHIKSDGISRSSTDGVMFNKSNEDKKSEENTVEKAEASKSLSSSTTTTFPLSSGTTSVSSMTSSTSTFSFGSAVSTTGTTASFGFGNASSTSTSSSKPFSFGNPASNQDSTPTTKTFSFGSASAGVTESSKTFSFGNTSKPFSFGSSTTSTSAGFSFGTPSASSEPAKTQEEEDPEDEPPKVEVKSVEEEDAVHSVRCKIFYRMENEFKEKGLGMLHLKKLDDGKMQLVIRAETNLGNILLNVLLNDKMMFKQNKNNVQFFCIPNPPIKGLDEGPVMMLVKVKTENMAEELMKKVQELS